MTWLHREPPTRVQRGVHLLLMLSVLLVGLTAYRAWSISPLPSAGAGEVTGTEPTLHERASYRVADAVLAVESDPFHPARRAPAARYVLPELDDRVAVSTPGAPQSGQVRLLGTVVSGLQGGFVMGQIGRESPKVLRIGDALGGLTLRSIERGQADFSRPDGTIVTLRIPGAATAPGA